MFIDFFLEPLYQNISRMPFSLHSVNLGQINKFKTYFSSVLTPFTSLMEGLKYELNTGSCLRTHIEQNLFHGAYIIVLFFIFR